MMRRLLLSALLALLPLTSDAGYGSGRSSGPSDPGSSRGTAGQYGATHPAQPPAGNTQTFAQRCAAAGVIYCEGFDDAADFTVLNGQRTGLHQNTGHPPGQQDTTIKASGASSLRFDIEGYSNASTAGSWYAQFPQSFGNNSHFYVQFQQRFSPEILDTTSELYRAADGGTTAWKQIDLYANAQGSYSTYELTVNQYYLRGFPQMYSNQGFTGLYTNLSRTTIQQNTPLLFQQGTSDNDGYNCSTEDTSYPTGTGNGIGCFRQTANVWITFYIDVQIVNLATSSTIVKAYVSTNGSPYKQWINVPNLLIDPVVSDTFDQLFMGPFITNKDATVNHPTASTWYDALIISTQPIAVPAVE